MKSKIAAIAMSMVALGGMVAVVTPNDAHAANRPDCTFRQEASGRLDGCVPHRWWFRPWQPRR